MTTDTKRLAERLRYTAQINLSRGLDEAHPWVGELNKAADALDAQAALLSEAKDTLRRIIAADDEFRATMSPEVEKDPLTRACNRASSLLSRIEAVK